MVIQAIADFPVIVLLVATVDTVQQVDTLDIVGQAVIQVTVDRAGIVDILEYLVTLDIQVSVGIPPTLVTADIVQQVDIVGILARQVIVVIQGHRDIQVIVGRVVTQDIAV